MAARLLPRVKQAELKRLRKVRSAKESVNQSFESLLTEIRNGGQTESNVGRELKAFSLNLEYTAGSTPGAPQAKIKRLKDKHKQQDDNLEKRQAIEKSKVKVNIQKAKHDQGDRTAFDQNEAKFQLRCRLNDAIIIRGLGYSKQIVNDAFNPTFFGEKLFGRFGSKKDTEVLLVIYPQIQ